MARQERTGIYKLSQTIVTTVMGAYTVPTWQGIERLPREGGFIVACNHVSYLDPLVVAHFLVKQRTYPYFMAKESLFRVPVTGYLLTGSQQIPVDRRTSRALDAYTEAIKALREDKVVVMFPEGTITRNADFWPMKGKTGAARLAVATGLPVVPVATWGGQSVYPAYGMGKRRLLQRAAVQVRVGQPLRFDQLGDEPPTQQHLQDITANIMEAVRQELVVLRSESTPATDNGVSS